mmetsp:Transcript_63025/g.176279  ORF Transcript_63025/g.176279 Transcript_63025/m.176279 type:complete len:416 (-) Transcript_63025:653-1900(-)
MQHLRRVHIDASDHVLCQAIRVGALRGDPVACELQGVDHGPLQSAQHVKEARRRVQQRRHRQAEEALQRRHRPGHLVHVHDAERLLPLRSPRGLGRGLIRCQFLKIVRRGATVALLGQRRGEPRAPWCGDLGLAGLRAGQREYVQVVLPLAVVAAEDEHLPAEHGRAVERAGRRSSPRDGDLGPHLPLDVELPQVVVALLQLAGASEDEHALAVHDSAVPIPLVRAAACVTDLADDAIPAAELVQVVQRVTAAPAAKHKHAAGKDHSCMPYSPWRGYSPKIHLGPQVVAEAEPLQVLEPLLLLEAAEHKQLRPEADEGMVHAGRWSITDVDLDPIAGLQIENVEVIEVSATALRVAAEQHQGPAHRRRLGARPGAGRLPADGQDCPFAGAVAERVHGRCYAVLAGAAHEVEGVAH